MIIDINDELAINIELISMIKYERPVLKGESHQVIIQSGTIEKILRFNTQKKALSFKKEIVEKINEAVKKLKK
jgi:hypothetical protein